MPAKGSSPQLNKAVISSLQESFADGLSVNIACGRAGIARRTFERWMRRGERELARIMIEHQVDDVDVANDSDLIIETERRYVAFVRLMNDARATYGANVGETLKELATKGIRTEKTVTKQGVYVKDGEAFPIEETTTTVEYRIDPATARWAMEKLDPEHYKRPEQVEITVSGAHEAFQAEAAELAQVLLRAYTDELKKHLPKKAAEKLEAVAPEAWAAAWEAVDALDDEVDDDGDPPALAATG